MLKIKTAQKHSTLFPQTFRRIWEKIPDGLKERLTGKELGAVVKLAYEQAQWGKNNHDD